MLLATVSTSTVGPVHLPVQGGSAYTGSAAHHGAGQQKSNRLGRKAMVLPGLLRSTRCAGARGNGIGVVSEAAAVSVVLTIIKVEIIGPHIDPLLKFFVLEVYPFDIAQYTGKI